MREKHRKGSFSLGRTDKSWLLLTWITAKSMTLIITMEIQSDRNGTMQRMPTKNSANRAPPAECGRDSARRR